MAAAAEHGELVAARARLMWGLEAQEAAGAMVEIPAVMGRMAQHQSTMDQMAATALPGMPEASSDLTN